MSKSASLFKKLLLHLVLLAAVAASGSPDDDCLFHSNIIPCFRWHDRDNQSDLVFEIELNDALKSFFPHSSSTHEPKTDPDGNLWVTQQNSDVLMKVNNLALARGLLNTTTADFRSFPLSLNTSGGLHQLHFPEKPKTDGLAYATLEFWNNTGAIGVWNWKADSPVISSIIPVPLALGNWTCTDFTAERGAGCPTGAHPHTLTEDSEGNLWITLKNAGAIARLRNPALYDPLDPSSWLVFQIPQRTDRLGAPGPLTFYIDQSKDKHYIWFNSITTSTVGVVKNPTAPSPVFNMIPLDTGFAAWVSSRSRGERDNAHPGGLKALRDGRCLVPLYNKMGAIAIVQPPEESEKIFLQTEGGNSAQPFEIVEMDGDTAEKHVKFVNVTSSHDAFLHLQAEEDEAAGTFTVWLLGSSNDFTGFRNGSTELQREYRAPDQGDALVRVRGLNLDSGKFGEVTRFSAPTQGSWLHRVLLLPAGKTFSVEGGGEIVKPVVIATELYSDRILSVVSDFSTEEKKEGERRGDDILASFVFSTIPEDNGRGSRGRLRGLGGRKRRL
uniref:Uncharacterized protein n=1 Tax=Chromera velia CCMP2878 TaxID=1169474 RepID=A0A0G4H658_9ALVE|eukprot:Cvel_24839.t1-p1 / transcript=Cvel_24839.t1 / gene=Cvel_24839 / organism=Chromera_velia_CCMP2878 / gene_product=hypothetical protein / transcript_product=hypothetical protein / location=Cvel_scaffold2740:9873-12392(-) / protein_length=553 / sequence_SO=supercontig / SO=protein_coding / is_pseudo=false